MNSIFLHSTLLQIGFLDTPSVLMVTLTALAFLVTWGINRISILRIRRRVKESKEIYDIIQHTLDVNANYSSTIAALSPSSIMKGLRQLSVSSAGISVEISMPESGVICTTRVWQST